MGIERNTVLISSSKVVNKMYTYLFVAVFFAACVGSSFGDRGDERCDFCRNDTCACQPPVGVRVKRRALCEFNRIASVGATPCAITADMLAQNFDATPEEFVQT